MEETMTANGRADEGVGGRGEGFGMEIVMCSINCDGWFEMKDPTACTYPLVTR